MLRGILTLQVLVYEEQPTCKESILPFVMHRHQRALECAFALSFHSSKVADWHDLDNVFILANRSWVVLYPIACVFENLPTGAVLW